MDEQCKLFCTYNIYSTVSKDSSVLSLPETVSTVSDGIIHRGTIQKVMVFTAQEFTAHFIAIQLCGYVLYILKILSVMFLYSSALTTAAMCGLQ
jgi:hypothetical protein